MKKLDFFKCNVCGNIDLECINGGGTRSCCNQPMKKIKANSTEAAAEKHLPVIERNGSNVRVNISSVEHPMTDDHYIQFIVIAHGDKVQKRALTPQDKPFAEFTVPEDEKITAYEYCNLHGLWYTVEE